MLADRRSVRTFPVWLAETEASRGQNHSYPQERTSSARFLTIDECHFQ